jgi:copper chaperone CopZ
VAKVVAKVKEVEGVKEVKAKAAAKEEGTIRTIYPIYQNRLVYKRLERIIVHFAIKRAISKGTITYIKGLKNLYLKSLRNLLI